jgi:AraC-like DNA-binding protein
LGLVVKDFKDSVMTVLGLYLRNTNWWTITRRITMMNMHNPAHPGEVLREWLPVGMPIEEAALQLHISRTTLSKVLNAKSGVSASMALRLAS